jgi:hypothetical protein
MIFRLKSLWTSLYWATRIAMLLVLFAIQWWQARYTWSVHNPMYGWPVSFNNVWIGDARRDWHPWLLALDAAVWIALLVSVGYALERLWRKAKPFQFSLGSMFGLQAIVAVVLAIGCAEGFLRENPNVFTIYPKYASCGLGGVTIGLDIGLFTDPPLDWPLARIAIILGIGCVVYTAGSLISRAVWRREAATSSRVSSYKSPAMARFLLWTLAVIDAFLLIATSYPTMIR